jgi:quinol monooxygenase YgiN
LTTGALAFIIQDVVQLNEQERLVTVVLVAKYFSKPGKMDAILSSLARMKAAVARDEPACQFYQASRSIENANLLMLYEHYPDEASLAAHRETPHFKAIIEGEVVPMLEKRERELFTLAIS